MDDKGGGGEGWLAGTKHFLDYNDTNTTTANNNSLISPEGIGNTNKVSTESNSVKHKE